MRTPPYSEIVAKKDADWAALPAQIGDYRSGPLDMKDLYRVISIIGNLKRHMSLMDLRDLCTGINEVLANSHDENKKESHA